MPCKLRDYSVKKGFGFCQMEGGSGAAGWHDGLNAIRKLKGRVGSADPLTGMKALQGQHRAALQLVCAMQRCL